MKKIVVRKKDQLYIKKRSEQFYCDFCGEKDVEVFESEFEDAPDDRQGNICMQICFNCVKQLAKLL